MQILFPFFSFLLLTSGCQESTDKQVSVQISVEKPMIQDTTAPVLPVVPKLYTQLVYEKKEVLKAAPGTKSVLFNTAGTRLYAMNLEGDVYKRQGLYGRSKVNLNVVSSRAEKGRTVSAFRLNIHAPGLATCLSMILFRLKTISAAFIFRPFPPAKAGSS